ncbi:hypothetical protein [Halomonas sp. 707B3]|uniref:hypothetical protein n=1 Tax=Halomonas sp. 707B3 TaxID=1681043 RepID=UPI00209F89B6|nr:hypothetical protein [Halomonas sp. 707B3]MCP1316313.1 hypothetical protein [Halomonas sp. 707B3]
MSLYFPRPSPTHPDRRVVLKQLLVSTGAALTLSYFPIAAAQSTQPAAPVLVNGWLLRAEDR